MKCVSCLTFLTLAFISPSVRVTRRRAALRRSPRWSCGWSISCACGGGGRRRRRRRVGPPSAAPVRAAPARPRLRRLRTSPRRPGWRGPACSLCSAASAWSSRVSGWSCAWRRRRPPGWRPACGRGGRSTPRLWRPSWTPAGAWRRRPGATAPGGRRGWRWRAGRGGRGGRGGAPTPAGGCMTSLWAAPAQAGRRAAPRAGTGRSPWAGSSCSSSGTHCALQRRKETEHLK